MLPRFQRMTLSFWIFFLLFRLVSIKIQGGKALKVQMNTFNFANWMLSFKNKNRIVGCLYQLTDFFDTLIFSSRRFFDILESTVATRKKTEYPTLIEMIVNRLMTPRF